MALLVGLTPSHTDTLEQRALDARERRLESAAYWCTVYAGDRAELAACVTIGIHESHWAYLVGAGRCSEMPEGERCDEGRARSWWQQQRAACPALWRTEPGSPGAIQAGARCAVSLWRGALYRCRGRHPGGAVAGAYAGYRGIDCEWVGGARRARTHAWVMGELTRRR